MLDRICLKPWTTRQKVRQLERHAPLRARSQDDVLRRSEPHLATSEEIDVSDLAILEARSDTRHDRVSIRKSNPAARCTPRPLRYREGVRGQSRHVHVHRLICRWPRSARIDFEEVGHAYRFIAAERFNVDTRALKLGTEQPFRSGGELGVCRDLVVERTEHLSDRPLFAKLRNRERHRRQDPGVEIEHRRTDCLLHDPRASPLSTQRVGHKRCISSRLGSEVHPQATCAAEPAGILLAHQGSAFDVASARVNNVTGYEPMPREPLGVLLGDPSDTIFYDPILTDVGGHDTRDAVSDIVGSMKLTTERSGLDSSAGRRDKFTEGRVVPLTHRSGPTARGRPARGGRILRTARRAPSSASRSSPRRARRRPRPRRRRRTCRASGRSRRP